MPKYYAVCAVADEPESMRKDELDIVGVKEYGWIPGRKEMDEYIAIPFESDKTLNQLREQLVSPLYDGDYHERDLRELDPEQSHGIIKPEEFYLYVQLPNDTYILRPEKLNKNKYKADLTTIIAAYPDFDVVKMRDKKQIYQPFMKKSVLVSQLEAHAANVDAGKPSAPKVTEPLIATDCGLKADEEKEFAADFSTAGLILDKHDGKAVKPDLSGKETVLEVK